MTGFGAGAEARSVRSIAVEGEITVTHRPADSRAEPGTLMPKRHATFRHPDLQRALRAAKAASIEIGRTVPVRRQGG